VEHGGYAAAGRVIGMPRSKLSRGVIDLENRLGVHLLQRSTRKLTVTDIGQEYYRHCVAMLVEASAAQEAIERSLSSAQGLVRLSGPAALICFEVGPMIARFMAANARVTVERVRG
jgi:DNA-binding transcriptional LysR family regulator